MEIIIIEIGETIEGNGTLDTKSHEIVLAINNQLPVIAPPACDTTVIISFGFSSIKCEIKAENAPVVIASAAGS